MNNEGLIEAADRLSAEVGKLDDKVDALVHKDKRRHVQFVVLALSVILDLLLSAGFFYALDSTADAQEKIKSNTSTIYSNCMTLNEEHKAQKNLWNGIIQMSAANRDPNEPSDPEALIKFNALLEKTYPQKDCGPAPKD